MGQCPICGKEVQGDEFCQDCKAKLGKADHNIFNEEKANKSDSNENYEKSYKENSSELVSKHAEGLEILADISIVLTIIAIIVLVGYTFMNEANLLITVIASLIILLYSFISYLLIKTVVDIYNKVKNL